MPSFVDRIRILYVVKSLTRGGAEILLLNTIRRLDKARYDISVVYIAPSDPTLVLEYEAAGATCIDLSSQSNSQIGRLRKLLILTARGNWSTIHIHSPLPGSFARIAARWHRSGRPILITTEHNGWQSFHPMTRFVNRATIPFDDHVLAVSRETFESMSARAKRKAKVVIHGLPLEDISQHLDDLAAANINIQNEALGTIVTVANLRPQKDHQTLIKALSILSSKRRAFKALIIGDGPEESNLRSAVADLGLQDQVHFLGKQSDVFPYLLAADLFALSSTHEGLPVALMEAVAVGLPVVSTSVGGIPDAFAGSGAAILVPPGDPTALADAILEVLNGVELRNTMSTNARALAVTFDLTPVIHLLEDLYTEQTGQHP